MKPVKSFGSPLLAMIGDYDMQREAYVLELEAEIKDLHKQLSKAQSQMLERDATADRYKLQAIMAGAFDNFVTKTEKPVE